LKFEEKKEANKYNKKKISYITWEDNVSGISSSSSEIEKKKK